MKIYIETWEDRNGLRLDIAFTQYEMEKMPIEYRCAKRNALSEEHGFNISCADRIFERIIIKENKE